MMDESVVVGRVLQASTTRLTVGCQPSIAAQNQAIPAFGSLVKAAGPALSPPGEAEGQAVTYGLVHNVAVEDDLFVRQLVAAGMDDEVYIADQRQRRQVPVIVEVLLVGFCSPLLSADAATTEPRYYLPPQPPTTLDKVYACDSDEIVRFTARHDWLSTILATPDIAVDALIPAALRAAAQARPADQREAYLVATGRELARLLAQDPIRLDRVLRQLEPRPPLGPDQ
jgi:hypothetical protein